MRLDRWISPVTPIFGIVSLMSCYLVNGERIPDELSSSLAEFRFTTCDQDRMRLRCPYSMTIDVTAAAYGHKAEDNIACLDSNPGQLRRDVIFRSDCLAPSSLQIVVGLCQDKRKCDILASPETFSDDPCPGTPKYLKVAFRCKPTSFRRRVACEGSDLSLECPRSQRIVIYSAMFGRTEEPSVECPAPSKFNIDCQSQCTVDVVKYRCHAQKHCSLPASVALFGSPCQPVVPKFLRVIYTCVPRKIVHEVRDNLTGSLCESSATTPSHTVTVISTQSTSTMNTKSIRVTSTSSVSTPAVAEAAKESEPGVITDWVRAWHYLSENKERLLLYLIVSLLVGIILILIVIIMRLAILRHRRKTNKTTSTTQSVELTKSTTVTPVKSDSVDHASGSNGYSASRYPPSESNTLLEEEEEEISANNNANIPSYNPYNSLRFPVPPPNGRFLSNTNSLDRRVLQPSNQLQINRVGSPPYDNTFRTNPNRMGSPAYDNAFRTSSNRLNHYVFS